MRVPPPKKCSSDFKNNSAKINSIVQFSAILYTTDCRRLGTEELNLDVFSDGMSKDVVEKMACAHGSLLTTNSMNDCVQIYCRILGYDISVE